MKNFILFTLTVLTLHSNTLIAQNRPFEEVVLNDFIEQTQLNVGGNDSMKFYWWLPVEFWKISFAQEPSMTKEQIDQFVKTMEPYTMMAIVEAEIGVFASMAYVDPDSLRKSVRMIDMNDIVYEPIPEAELNFEVMMMLNMLKPMMANMLGEMGENIQFLVFHNEDKKGKRVFSPYVANSVYLKSKELSLTWETPLECLLELKRCPIDEELHSGAWIYCPYHGEKLKKK